MSKKAIYAVSALAVVLLALAGWFFYQSRTPKEVVSPEILVATENAAQAQFGASTAVGKTNPFATDVNPMQGYKNPFE